MPTTRERVQPSGTNLHEHLERQLNFLRRSAEAYDAGHHDEAVRIGTTLRVLFHDTPKSISLLTQLGAKGRLAILTTIPDAYVQIPGTDRYLARLSPMVSPDTGFVPLLDTKERSDLLNVDAWWRQFVICRNDPLTRCDIVLAAANQDGGAHVDPEPKSKTRQLQVGVGSYRPKGAAEDIPLVNVHFPLLRQFAYEVLNSPGLSVLHP